MSQFIDWVNDRFKLEYKDYESVHRWSIEQPDDFWSTVWDFFSIRAQSKGSRMRSPSQKFQDTQWFPNARLNFVENLLARDDEHLALIAIGEDGRYHEICYCDLNKKVAQLAFYLRSVGVVPGDRVAGYLPNVIETVIAMLASARLGAIWSSCSPDFGLQGLLDRFGQIEPKILFAVDGHLYNGKSFHHLDTIAELQKHISSIEKTVVLGYFNKKPNLENLKNTLIWEEVFTEHELLDYDYFPFNHPLYILYTSGTTGKPKCLVHGAGGTLIQHLKELGLHTNVHAQDRIFYYTTCGWMMWNWLMSSLALGATLILYDGAPLFPTPDRLFNLIDELKISIFGISAKYLESIQKAHLTPITTHSLQSLKTILSTGSPLLPESFDYVYSQVKKDVCLSSISGGSDIISCFALGNPLLPVYRGEIQCIGLGMNVRIFNEQGQSVIGEKGELVCTSPFPSMPTKFWHDTHGKKYENAYFKKFPGVWSHGDYATLTKRQTLIIFGRSDATLNPGGVRVGTAEIYQQVNQMSEILEALAVGQHWNQSERIILFVKLAPNTTLDENLKYKIKAEIRHNVSPHHVPAKIIAVQDLPRTLNNKIAELTVKKIIHGEDINNTEALANPEVLKEFQNLPDLKNQ